MADSSQKTAGKINVECPHCGFKQLESVFAKSTYCRKCSRHLEIGKQPHHKVADAKEGSFFNKFTRLLQREQIKTITCYGCNKTQQVSSFAKSSICPHCSAYIDLRDFKISTAFSRSIQTQGTVAITPKGDVMSSKIVCGSAIIFGKIQGALICTGTTRVKTKGRLLGAIESRELIIEKKSDVEFVRALKAGTAEIHGKLSARINADFVKIGKTGALEGTVYAKSISVEKGGIFHGELFIGKHQLAQQELIPTTQPGLLDLGNQGALALG